MFKTINIKKLLSILMAVSIVMTVFCFSMIQKADAEEQSYVVNGTDTTFSISSPRVKTKEYTTNWYIAKKTSYKDIPDISMEFYYPNDFNSVPGSGIYHCFKIYNNDSFSNDSLVGELNSSEFSFSAGKISVSLSADSINNSGITFEELKTYYIVVDPFFGSTQFGTDHSIVIQFVYYLPYVQYPDYKATFNIEPGEILDFKIPIEDDDIDMIQLYDDLSYNSFGDSKTAKIAKQGITFHSNHSMDIDCRAEGFCVGGSVFLVRQTSTGRLIAEVHVNVQNVNYRNTCIDCPIDFTYYTDSYASSLNFDGYYGGFDVVSSHTEYIEDLELYKQFIAVTFDTAAENFSVAASDASQTPVVYYHVTTRAHDFNNAGICNRCGAEDRSLKRVTINKNSIEMATKEKDQLELSNVPSEATVSWSSSNPAVATVDNNGLVTAKTYGKAVITAAIVNGTESAKRSCDVQTRFYDVSDKTASGYTQIYWAADNGITKGYNGGEYFGPTQKCTRQEFAIFLWRALGQPAPKSTTLPFKDTKDLTGSSLNAIAWATEKGIIKGYDDNTFRPKNNVTREQIVIMLWRAAGEPKASKDPGFADTASLDKTRSSYKAIAWASENGIVQGFYADNTFRPKDNSKRNQVVIMLYRYVNKFLKA